MMAKTTSRFIGLHLTNAYAFGKMKNLENEVHEIHYLPIKDKKTKQPRKRALIAMLFEHEGIYEEYLEYGWPVWKSKDGRKSIDDDKQSLAKEYTEIVKPRENDARGVVLE